ncbi:MAG: hypothetical protein HY917_00540 [Candidatus Diapherotrites archaeon]|nr:hypothetical protein [Candidatus Diapherotrites archaeon]
MKMRSLLVLLGLLLAGISTEAAQPVSFHDVEITFSKEGTATVLEKYTLSFSSILDEQAFQKKARENASLGAWRSDYPFIYPHFAPANSTPQYAIYYDETQQVLSLSYEVTDPLAKTTQESARSTDWEIRETVFENYISAARIIIPKTTRITFILPLSAEIKPEQNQDLEALISQGKAQAQQNRIQLNGPITTNALRITYQTPKQILPQFNSGILAPFLENPLLLLALAVTLVLAGGFAYQKRKTITQGIEDYIVAHSEIEKKESGEIELELD